MHKQAEVIKRARLYFACRAILRVKYGSYAVPPTNKFMKKQAVVINPIGIASGALTGGGLGYSGGKWLSDKMGLDENSWGAKALRWGGGALGAVAGGALGNFGVDKIVGWGGKTLGAAGKLLGFGSKATKAVGAASKAVGAANKGSKFMRTAKVMGRKALNAAKDPDNWQKGLDYLSDMTSTGYNDNVQPPPPQQQIYQQPNQGGQYNPAGNLSGTNIPVVSQAPNSNPTTLADSMAEFQQHMQQTA